MKKVLIGMMLAGVCVIGCRAKPVALRPAFSVPELPRLPVPIHLTLVATNDLHGWVQPHVHVLKDGRRLEEGGAAAFAGYLSNLRQDNPGGVLLVDAGDLFQGTLIANLSEGAVVVDVYNALGYQAAALGNHEFDYGPEGPVSVALTADQDPFGALKARIRQAHFPFLAVNIYEADTGARPTWLGNDGTLMVELKGVKIGIIGLITPSTPQTTDAVNVSHLRFGSLLPEAISASSRLRKAGAEVVVAVAHAGGKCEDLSDPDDLSSCDVKTSEIFQMMRGLPPDTLDAVVAGHTHMSLGHRVNGIPVVETSGQFRSFSVIDLWVDGKTHAPITQRTKIESAIPIRISEEGTKVFRGRPVDRDQAISRRVEAAEASVQTLQDRRLGLTVPRSLRRNYEAESGVGSLMMDSLREMEEADVALMNPGSLRADIPAGELTYGKMYEVLPFDNRVARLTLSGKDLKRLIQASYIARKGVFQISGMQIRLARCLGQGRLRKMTMADGTPVDPEKQYRVALSDFLARGGDGLGSVVSSLNPDKVDFGTTREGTMRDEMVAFWQHHHPVLESPSLGRITFVDGQHQCH